jgi:hypothetical protein
MGFSFISKFFSLQVRDPFLLFELIFTIYGQVFQMNKFHPHCLLMMAALIFYQVLLASEACLPRTKYALDFGGELMCDGINLWLHFLLMV